MKIASTDFPRYLQFYEMTSFLAISNLKPNPYNILKLNEIIEDHVYIGLSILRQATALAI